MDLAERRELNNGFGNTLARSFEFAVTPMIFAAAGFGLDRWLGTSVVFTIALLVFGLSGVVIRWYYDYSQRIDALESRRVAEQRSAPLAAPVLGRPVEPGATLPTGVRLDDAGGGR